ncbi:MAG TPA: mycothiol synthase [Jatrophihabitans sp.]|nr:mycothiol synthase [Jatrophihabitans sp.]
MSLQTSVLDSLDADQLAAVRELVRTAPGNSDTPPISERGMLALTEPGRRLLALDGGAVRGYAQLADGAAELVAADVETAQALLRQLPAGTRLWAHGEQSMANQAAGRAGWRPVRTLLQLRATLTEVAEQPLPEGVRIRPFVPGQDDTAWLAVNARAFAGHPEQGRWRQHDLDLRLRADWFDPAGFLLAVSGEKILGYHWTKVHASRFGVAVDPPLGEVYVLGIDPDAQGMRLGSALLAAGLRHLLDRGLHTVLLYVEQDNPAALRLYRRAGFSRHSADLQYAIG